MAYNYWITKNEVVVSLKKKDHVVVFIDEERSPKNAELAS